MPNTIILGMHWGDEGKGKDVDILSDKHKVIVRYQGGGNAGHTVVIGNARYALHLIPSGILRNGKINILGHNVVIDPKGFYDEVKVLRDRGVEVEPDNLLVSDRAHLTLLYHNKIDVAAEEFKSKKGGKIGTTGRGIGPTYEDKVGRRGIRVCDLHDVDELRKKVEEILGMKNEILECYEAKELSLEDVMDNLLIYKDELLRFSHHDIGKVILEHDGSVLAEGAQGTLLDVDLGTVPFVTSSNSTIGGFYTGTGTYIGFEHVIGILKAYTTRVGEGPFPTELKDETGERLRKIGNEFGTTTGRPRKCGWLDLFTAKYAIRVNGITEMSLTKLDVLSDEDVIDVCTGYVLDGKEIDYIPADAKQLNKCEPIYEILPGWKTDISKVKKFDDLPKEAREYVEFIENYLGRFVTRIGVGPRRDQTLEVE